MTISPRLLFLSFLGLGLVTGLFVGTLSQAMAAPSDVAGQHNTLFVLVDDLKSEHPILEGIWLAALPLGSIEWNWMPIYPVPLDESKSEYATPHSAFYLPSNSFSDPNLLPPLQAQRVWWDEVIWLDESALGLALSLSGYQSGLSGDTWLEPQRALLEQVRSLKKLCKGAQTGAATDAGSLDQLLAVMPDHLRTSLNPFELITRWDDWSKDEFALSCTHPWAD
ncbi:MAG: hypothetical protein WD740_06630 [Anaerolineales bacterium]